MAGRVVDNPSICFGSKKLFKAQFNLAENNYVDHAAWLEEWRNARNSHFKFDGDALQASGNAFARITERDDGLFDLEMRLPEKLNILLMNIA